MFIPFKQKSCRMQKEGNKQRKINAREIKTQEHKKKKKDIKFYQWRIQIRRSGLAEHYDAAFCTLPLDLASGSGFATQFCIKSQYLLNSSSCIFILFIRLLSKDSHSPSSVKR